MRNLARNLPSAKVGIVFIGLTLVTGNTLASSGRVNSLLAEMVIQTTDRRQGGATDVVNAADYPTLQAAADAAGALGKKLVARGAFTLSETLVLNCAGDLSAATVSAASKDFSPVIRVGTNTGGPTLLNGSLYLPKVVNLSKPERGWAGQGVGVELANLYQALVTVPEVSGFAVGLDCGGYTSGFSYNTITILMLSRNKIGLRLQGKIASTGWANQDVFIGGRTITPTRTPSSAATSRTRSYSPSREWQLSPECSTRARRHWKGPGQS